MSPWPSWALVFGAFPVPWHAAGSKYDLKRFHLPWQSQSQQDSKLVERIFRSRRKGFYVELGAADGKFFSNTYALEHGMDWTGILIEPLAEQVEKCRMNRPSSVCVQACVTKVPGEVVEFREFAGQLGILHSTLARLSDDETQPGETLRRMQCRTLPDILKEHRAPHFMDWLSLDVERAEMEILESLFEDGSFHFDVISLEANTPQESSEKFFFMQQHNYQYMDRFGHDDVYVSAWTQPETSCNCQWLRQKLVKAVTSGYKGKHHAGLLQHARRALGSKNLRRLNDSTVVMYQAWAWKARRWKCRSADMNSLMRITLLEETKIFLSHTCSGAAFMESNELQQKLNMQNSDSCAPLFGLQLGRMDFLSVLRSRWPTFLQLQLLSERMHAAWQSRWQLCDLDNSQLPRDFAHLTRDFVDKEVKVCGTLSLILRYLHRANETFVQQPQWWMEDVTMAERLLKTLGDTLGVPQLLSTIGRLPEQRSPWVMLSSMQRRWW